MLNFAHTAARMAAPSRSLVQITQALSSGELCVGHADNVAPSREVSRPAVGLVFVYQVFKVFEWHD
jgi:hypothetical protein